MIHHIRGESIYSTLINLRKITKEESYHAGAPVTRQEDGVQGSVYAWLHQMLTHPYSETQPD